MSSIVLVQNGQLFKQLCFLFSDHSKTSGRCTKSCKKEKALLDLFYLRGKAHCYRSDTFLVSFNLASKLITTLEAGGFILLSFLHTVWKFGLTPGTVSKCTCRFLFFKEFDCSFYIVHYFCFYLVFLHNKMKM